MVGRPRAAWIDQAKPCAPQAPAAGAGPAPVPAQTVESRATERNRLLDRSADNGPVKGISGWRSGADRSGVAGIERRGEGRRSIRPLSRRREGRQDCANRVGILKGGDQAQAPAAPRASDV